MASGSTYEDLQLPTTDNSWSIAASAPQMKCDNCYDVFDLYDIKRCSICNGTMCPECIYSGGGQNGDVYCCEEHEEGAERVQREMDEATVEDDRDSCFVCGKSDRPEDLMECDGKGQQCPMSAHFDCIGLSQVPEADWFCCECEQMNNQECDRAVKEMDEACVEWFRKHDYHLKRNWLSKLPGTVGEWGIIVYPPYTGPTYCLFKARAVAKEGVELEYYPVVGKSNWFERAADDQADRTWAEHRKHWRYLNKVQVECQGAGVAAQWKISTPKKI